MTATESLYGARRGTNNSALLRLERINQNLLSLKSKLSSYMCEPKTLVLYQKLDALKFQVREMRNRNHDLISDYYNNSLDSKDIGAIVQQQFRSYKDLELKVLEYIGMAKLHC